MWADWLQAAGLLTDGIQTSRGTVTMATDGHHCRSLLERHIDDYLFSHGIKHECEPHYPFDNELNPNGMRADWKLEDGTFVEAWGLPEDPRYAAKIARKGALATKNRIHLVEVTADDLDQLPDLFAPWRS